MWTLETDSNKRRVGGSSLRFWREGSIVYSYAIRLDGSQRFLVDPFPASDMPRYDPQPLEFLEYPSETILQRAADFYQLCQRRRSVRHFSSRPIPKRLIEYLIMTAGTAPSGANKQPWTFVAVTDPELKHEIRMAAEKEERESYERRMPKEWLEDLEELGTDWHKEFLETAPCLIVVFRQDFALKDDEARKHYYVIESVGIAVGFLLAAIHNAGLAALTHTPNPMGFLTKILDRPRNETPYVLIPIGYPAEKAVVPTIRRKDLSEILVWDSNLFEVEST